MQRFVLGGIGLVAVGVLWWLLWPRAESPAEVPAEVVALPVPAPPTPARKPVVPRGERSVPLPDPVGVQKTEAILDPTWCADLDAVTPVLLDGTPSADVLACLEARIAADDDAESVLRLLTVYAWNVDRALWSKHAVQLASITTDPDLHYKLALHFAKDEQPEVALHHVEVAEQEGHTWPDDVVDKRMAALANLRGRLCLEAQDVPYCD